MNIVDIIIIIFLLFEILIGIKRGFTRELVSLVGDIVITILAFLFKNIVSVFFYNNLPFINFGGAFKDAAVINILFYEILAFFSIYIVLFILLRILFKATKIFEKFLSATIILGIPSKILGGILGLIQGVVTVFIALYVLNLPTFNFNVIKESKIGNTILNRTPILASICNKTLDSFDEIVELKEEYETTNNIDKFNQKALDIMIDKKIITKNNVKKLIAKGKLKNVTVE